MSRASESPARTGPQRGSLPDAVGLCPVHQHEFYFPVELPLFNPFVRCPEPDCDKYLSIYTPR